MMESETETKVIEHESTSRKKYARMVEPLAVGTTVGRYELVHRLGHGGMAAVFLGRATGRAGFEKLLAVKVIHPHLAAEPEFVEMFLDEARIAARLHHPNIVEIHDLGDDEGVFYMVMEYVEGETLAAVLRQLRKEDRLLPLSAVLQIMADSCAGLAAAHDLKHADGEPMHLVHRDVSPHNLLVGMDGRVKVVDFGIAKATGRRSSTRTGQLRGKLAYMSPEQAGGKSIDHRTDLFALGTVLWELLTNERLFVAETESETLARVTTCEVPDIREHREGLSDGVVQVVERALARDPDERYGSAHDMLRELRSLLRGLEDDVEPREDLSTEMKRLFEGRIDYVRAAVRRASESGARPERAANGPLLSSDVTQAAEPPTAEPSNSSASSSEPGQGTGPLAAATAAPGGTGTQTLTASLATAPARHWGLWLVLPLVGAVVGAAIVSGRFGVGEELTTPEKAERQPDELPSQAGFPVVATVVKWQFEPYPSGATITLDGVVQAEKSPTTIEVSRGDEPIVVEISKPGFRSLILHPEPRGSSYFGQRLEPLPDSSDPDPDPDPDPIVEVVDRPKSGGLRLRARPKKHEPIDGAAAKPDPKESSAEPTDPDLGELEPAPKWDSILEDGGEGKGRETPGS